MTVTARAPAGDGMDRSPTPEGKALPSVTRPLPLSESEAEISSVPASTRSSFEQARSVSSDRRTSFPPEAPRTSDPRGILLKAFLPRVAVYASQDTEDLVRLKGIYGGLCGLLRPFGEEVQGKVGIRDSVGVSKSWDDYGVHFVRLQGTQEQAASGTEAFANPEDSIQEGDWSRILKATPAKSKGTSALDEVIAHSLNEETSAIGNADEIAGHTPEYYNLFLRKLLADRPLVSYDTFSHPVACVVAISSQTPDPIATLGDLYHQTGVESGNLPPWVSNSFLRYYVLVHDEDHDDITVSTALFAQMKRNFGLHCHMLRLRSVECAAQDPDGGPLPECHWLPAEDDLADIKQREGAAANELQQYIFDSDASVMRTFVRELVTQSIIPYMESRVTTWNEVASRRRGVAGRIMSMSKRWTGFGSVRGKISTPAADRDFDPSQGAYKPESNTATMHRLADYAFMLRDWKLAAGIYDLLRSDFNDDKAWHHYAVAHEMAALSMLLTGQSSISRSKVDTINQLLDTASYSFITRCSSPREAIRCMILAVELFINNAGMGAKEAERWGNRMLELSILTPIVQALLTERIAVGNRFRSPFLEIWKESPLRKAALWNLLSAESWISQQQSSHAERQLASAFTVYGEPENHTEFAAFEGTQDYLRQLRGKVAELGRSITPTGRQEPDDTFIEDLAPSQLIALGTAPTNRHSHSHSVSHRRGLSQQVAMSAIPRNEQDLQDEDDGFS